MGATKITGVFRGTLLWAMLALACGSDRIAEGVYAVKSDCKDGTVKDGTMKLKQKSQYKSGLKSDYEADDAKTFGFPTNDWERDGAKIIAKGTSRECHSAAFEDHDTQAIFTCRNGSGNLECTISLNKKGDLPPS